MMRVIAGQFGGVPLAAVPGKHTRPTTDKVKEALFNILGQYFAGGIVLDFYAGSGALGLEALSRGAEQVYACEQNRQAQQTIRKNVQKTQTMARYHLLTGDNQRALKRLRQQAPDLQFDLVFSDPPYQHQHHEQVLRRFQAEHWLSDTAIVVCELAGQDNLPAQIGQLQSFKNVRYGQTRLVCYQLTAG